ncbi:RsmB/NOP family class I SAM-dependent RNA methyltransferase [Sutterella sp.]|uniref:RsmB/NOP family class I SAM-dependent RNA methyltransferase n=1 Tax=Sutterella sp. TaxID=1981025 RepID=UPI0026DEEA71|nr:RsmB/NOP family class I SAM-dependent RNA methyltransferase [Sutterella sp.]MDO5532075.1 RsmB/NOP family class I SAM-dependent RNA methyltransferase [Sutterella sp.]
MPAENHPKKRRAFEMQKPRRTERPAEGKKRTERQIAADKRRRAERAAEGNVRHSGPKTPEHRMAPKTPGKVRITTLIVDELARALKVILRFDGPADVLMKLFFKSNPQLGMRDRGLIAEGIYDALRRYGTLRAAMRPVHPDRAPKLAALAVLARQHGIDALPPSAIGSEEGPLKNVLAFDASKAPAHVAAELPQWMFDLIEAQYPDSKDLYQAMVEGAPLDLRVNLLKTTREEVLAELAKNGVEAHPTPLSPDGVRLPTKPGLTRWPIYQDGLVDVQDEGSQLIARLLTPRRREMICDFCAGAGGKTLAIGALMRSTGSLYAFDVNEKRLAGLAPRMRRAGLTNVHPIAIRSEQDPRVRRLNGKFDRVLVDAPCTGTGTLRRNPDLKWRLSPEELNRINEIQKSVLASAAKLVKKGGRLVYATCSLLKRENQDVVEAFLAENPGWKLVPVAEVFAQQGITFGEGQLERFGGYMQLLPHVNNTDGFFSAVLQRDE